MRILFVNWKDMSNPAAGGAENFTEEIGRRRVGLGHEVTIFASFFDGCTPQTSNSGMTIFRDGGKYTVYSKARSFARHHSNEFDIIVDEINTVPFQMHKVSPSTPLVALIHQLAREVWFYETRFPLSALGYYVLEPWWLHGYRNIRTITVSPSTKDDLVNLGFKDVRIVHNGINVVPLDSIPHKEGVPIIIFLGRLVRSKLPDHAVKAFELIRASFPDAELWVLGDGYLRNKLELRANGGGIRFFGRVNEREKFDLLKRAHVLLAPSVREGWGISVIEANAMGTPAVGYDVPGLRDSIVDGVTGFLADRLSPESLAKATREILSDSMKAETLSRSALEWSKKFSWDGAAAEFQGILESTIDGS
jgi:glycosyltransferase involved in cell wall biosynthesis